jgi:hypothetical protein
MLSQQREFRLLVVIEGPSLPGRSFVAVAAALPEAPLVSIVHGMTTLAVHGRVLERLRGMAERTIDTHMSSVEGEIGLVMIEARLPPRVLGVTLGTFFAELRFVDVVIRVASDAVMRSLAVLAVCRMAGPTLRARVGADEWVVGRIVIEGLCIEDDDMRASSEMFAVAAAARASRRRRLRPVETLSGLQVRRDLLVAVEAQASFGAAIERTVATSAFRFDVGVPLDYRTRAHEQLEVDGRGRAPSEVHQGAQRGERQKNDSIQRHYFIPFDAYSVHVDGDHMDDR